MALPRKGSREIVVEGRTFRWAVSPDSGYMVVVVQDASGAGRRLTAYFDYGDVIAPVVVRALILQGLAGGWSPDEHGPQLRIAASADVVRLARAGA